jgi:hypothetical protein
VNHSVTLQRLSRLNENPFSLNSNHHQNSAMDGVEARHEWINGFRDLTRSDSNGRARCLSPNRSQSSGNRTALLRPFGNGASLRAELSATRDAGWSHFAVQQNSLPDVRKSPSGPLRQLSPIADARLDRLGSG